MTAGNTSLAGAKPQPRGSWARIVDLLAALGSGEIERRAGARGRGQQDDRRDEAQQTPGADRAE